MNEKKIVYCPRGCNESLVAQMPYEDECAACGSIMRPEYGEEYDLVHIEIENQTIDEFVRLHTDSDGSK